MTALIVLTVLLLAVAVLHHFVSKPASIPRVLGGWGNKANEDPRVALAAMMLAVAGEDGEVAPAQEDLMLAILTGNVGLDARTARDCLKHGKRLERHVRREGDLTSRLHRLREPIARQCNLREREDVIEALREVAGSRAKQIGSVRDAIGRLAATLLHA